MKEIHCLKSRVVVRAVQASLVLLATAVEGCETGRTDEPLAASNAYQHRQAPATDSCGFYEKKACDPNQIVEFYQDDIAKLPLDAFDCGKCALTLTAVTIAAVGGTVASDGLLSVPAAGMEQLAAALECAECFRANQENGVFATLSCSISPCQYSTEGRQQECQALCTAADTPTKYGFVEQGTTSCDCTDDPTEARCRAKAPDGYRIDDDCTFAKVEASQGDGEQKSSGDACADGSVDASQTWCGRSGDDANVLYDCVDGQWNVVMTCPDSCIQQGNGEEHCG
jgi:hypothetical protein